MFPEQTELSSEELEEISNHPPADADDTMTEEKLFDAKSIVQIINHIESAINGRKGWPNSGAKLEL